MTDISRQALTHLSPCRNYSADKVAENLECEIMHVAVEEALESYR